MPVKMEGKTSAMLTEKPTLQRSYLCKTITTALKWNRRLIPELSTPRDEERVVAGIWRDALPPRPTVDEPPPCPNELMDVLLEESLGWSPINCFCFVASRDTSRLSAWSRKCSAKPQNALGAQNHNQSCYSSTPTKTYCRTHYHTHICFNGQSILLSDLVNFPLHLRG